MVSKGFGSHHTRTIKVNFALFTHQGCVFCIWSGWMNEEKFYEGRCDKQFTDGEPCLFLLLTTFVFPSNTIRSQHMSFFNLVLIQPTFYLPDNIEDYVNLKLFFNL